MTAITYAAAHENLESTMDRVCEDHDPVVITREQNEPVVMLSLEDYESIQETAFLMGSPRNTKRLLESIEALNNGIRIEKKIEDLDVQ